jgi:colanic acid biosynthesis glycosyl transferase WcaI
VLLLVNQFPPDVNPSGKLMKELARGLALRGHELHVVTTFPHYAEFRVDREYRGKWIERTDEDGVRVSRVWVFASGAKQRMWHRLANYVSYNAAAFLAAQASAADYDVILAPNGSFFTGVTAAALRLLRGTRFIYNVQDIYPDVPARAGQLDSTLQVRGLQLIERAMYNAAAHVTVIANAQRENLLAKGVPADRITVIPNFVDLERITPQTADAELIRRFGWPNKLVVAHSGNLGFAYDLDTLLDAAHLLRDRTDIQFVIIGDGVRKADLQQRAERLALRNLQFLPFQPEADLPRLRASVDVQVSLYRRRSSELSLPSKLYEIMASGRPVIASAEADSDVARLIQQAGSGIVVEPERADLLAEAVSTLSADAALRMQLGERGRRYVTNHHSVKSVLDQYEALLEQVAGRH